MTDQLDPVLASLDVSRETIDRLQDFERLLKKWNKAINLVSSSTLSELWSRHIIDSAQIIRYSPKDPRSWVDLGSGGGLPGAVVAIVLAEISPATVIMLVESDTRKATFLRTAIRELNLKTNVIANRIEDVAPLDADVVSARALAPLPILLGYVERHLSTRGTALLQKGQAAGAEIDDARKGWIFDCTSHTSMTDDSARILEIKGLKRA